MTDRALEEIRAALEGRYRVEEMIGRGGMATVAIKVLRPELAFSVMARRFHLEVEILKELDHPGILPLYDSGESNQLLYFVMPFARGESLRLSTRFMGRERKGVTLLSLAAWMRWPYHEFAAATMKVAGWRADD